MLFLVKILTAFTLLLCSFSLRAQDAATIYIRQYQDIAIKQMQQYGIPASIILAQASLESANGTSRLAKKANNHFGIKCHNWSGKSIKHDDDSKNECFRKYNSPEQSYMDHSLFLTERPRYRNLFLLDITDYKGWANGLKSAGYATNPRYAQLLISIIEKYSLHTLDKQGRKNFQKTIREADSPLDYIPLKRKVHQNNGVEFIITSPKDTYESIAKEFGLFTRELLRFNDFSGKKQLYKGTILYIEKKKRKLKEGYKLHTVSYGETIHDISQQYGIRLKNLNKLNNLTEKDIIKPGDTIKLR